MGRASEVCICTYYLVFTHLVIFAVISRIVKLIKIADLLSTVDVSIETLGSLVFARQGSRVCINEKPFELLYGNLEGHE